MAESLEVAIKLCLSALGLGILFAEPIASSRRWQLWLRRGTFALASCSVLAFANFGVFHGQGRFPHLWEQFHYFLGSKYFAELGYDGLYVASMGAEMQADPGARHQPFLRDLRDNSVVATESLQEHGYAVHRRFSPERWAAFRADNAFFVGLDRSYLQQIRTDHGYNPTPAWTFVAQLFDSNLAAGSGTAVFLGALDMALLALAFWVFFRTYGVRTGCWALIVFGTGYAWRYFWTGGAFLRQDWLAATIMGVCALKQRRFGFAGALLGYASMVRVFPLVFLIGPCLQGARDAMLRRSCGWWRRLVTGAVLTMALLFAAGSATGRGAKAWSEALDNLQKHRQTWLTNNVGLKNTVLYDADTYQRRLVDWNLPEPWIRWQQHMNLLQHERRWLVFAVSGLMVLLALRAFWIGDQVVAAVAGLAVVFALAEPTCYYWSMLLLTLVRRPLATARALLGLNVLLCAAHLLSPVFEFRYGVMSWGLLLFFLWWLPDRALLERLRGIFRRGQPARAAGAGSTLGRPWCPPCRLAGAGRGILGRRSGC